MNELGDFIRQKRGNRPLREFAALCDISHTHLDSIEKGCDPRTGKPVAVTVEVLSKIAKATNVDVLSLVSLLVIGEQHQLDSRSIEILVHFYESKEGEILTSHLYQNYIIQNIDELSLLVQYGYLVPIPSLKGAKSFKITERGKSYIERGATYIENTFPISIKKIPILGSIACGKPIFANEERESYVLAGTDIKADFCLVAKGDSMIGARIKDGDIVFIRQQSLVEHGEIAAVAIGDEVTLKRVYYYQNKMKIVLQAENPKYEPIIFEKSDLNSIIILGKAVAFQSDLK